MNAALFQTHWNNEAFIRRTVWGGWEDRGCDGEGGVTVS